RRFLRAARALAPDRIPGWKDAVAAARTRLAEEAEKRAPGVGWPDRSLELLRSLIRRGGGATSGVLDLARRLSEVPALKGLDEAAFFTAAEFGELRRLAPGSALYRTGDRAGEISLVVSGSVDLIRTTPVGDQPLGEAGPGDFVGGEALTGAARTGDAPARGAPTLLGFAPDFFSPDQDRGAWRRSLRGRPARPLHRFTALSGQFFPGERAPAGRASGEGPAEG